MGVIFAMVSLGSRRRLRGHAEDGAAEMSAQTRARCSSRLRGAGRGRCLLAA